MYTVKDLSLEVRYSGLSALEVLIINRSLYVKITENYQ